MLTLLCLFVTVAAGVSAADFSDCPTSLTTLEEALYRTGDNLLQLNRIFFPSSTRTSRFIRVLYSFQDNPSILADDNCQNISFVWAIGSYLFFQPPTVFYFTSLFFNYPNNDFDDLRLVLPSECKPLVFSEEDGECTCRGEVRHIMLDVLTQQLNIYARFTNQGNIERQNTFARAVCTEDLYDIYYSGKNSRYLYSIITSAIILPSVIWIIFILSVRNLKSATVEYFTKPANHRHLVAVSYTGIIISTMIFITDILACIPVATNNHEYAKEITRPSINLEIVYVTLILDTIFVLPSFLCILYILWINITGCENRKMSTSGKAIRGFFKLFIGERSFNKIQAVSDEDLISYTFPILFSSSVLCISSHIGYIILAWVTEPSKSTANLILYYLIIVFFYISFRKFYTLHEKTHLKWWCLSRAETGEKQEAHHTGEIEMENITTSDPKKSADSTSASGEIVLQSEVSVKKKSVKRAYYCISVVKVKINYVNPQAFCFQLFYSVLLVAITLMIIFIFLLLPISSESLLTYLFNAIQLLVVLITTQVAFKLFFSSDFNLREAMKSFREYFAQKRQSNKDENIDGHLTSIVVDKTLGLEKATGAVFAEVTNRAVYGNAHNTD